MNRSTNELLVEQEETDDLLANSQSLVSILLHNYDGHKLEHCLHSIFNQPHIRNFEVIICDDDSKDGAWKIANRYALIHDGKITISRNKLSLGNEANSTKGRLLCKGEYSVELTGTNEFDSAYVLRAIRSMEADIFLDHSYISRLKLANVFLPKHNPKKEIAIHERTRLPLVSVLVFNFNYGRYLRQCLESVFAQTYENIEICFSDNASTDDSWEVALEFAERYPERISLTRNRMNYGPNVNLWNCLLNMRGKYMLKLCSDDAIQPEFIERCVNMLEKHPDTAFAMVHRDVMDENGKCTPEPPFYDQSCIIPGTEQAAVYMMSSVNPSISQILYKLEKTEGKRMAGNLNDRWFGDRIMDFHICCDSPIVYIKEPLLLNRVHPHSDGARLDGNLLQCMGEFVLLHQLSDIAGNYRDMDKARDRLPSAIEKIGRLCLRYSLRCLAGGDELCAKRYFHLAVAVFPNIQDDAIYIELSRYWSMDSSEREFLLQQLMENANNVVKRVVSYSPPPGSIPC
ncbi:MAG: glycosyltransferase [Sulfurimicrobium sp.]|nr:glycosyltransferase [Sulfurimicrobium sp.]